MKIEERIDFVLQEKQGDSEIYKKMAKEIGAAKDAKTLTEILKKIGALMKKNLISKIEMSFLTNTIANKKI